ncbi:MAG: DNA polymerase III subunit gamma/tau [Alphaproteobacteria bacterium]|nr:DNA polymerase III subunit gamma/tau [Alphaproteobacteria bacterium]
MSDSVVSEKQKPYQVLARKYRPTNFDELIGQDALVRTLKNAIESDRIAHAYMLTGIRGTGKTTTARIIAKAINYTGSDGKAGPTTGPTDNCKICQAITEDRHPDVIEMNGADQRGIDDIRQLIDGVRYAPSEARYKIYIIDEVHMLTDQAFNALLKTLEEPPAHVKFIFATTEIRKVPVTILSRCQRFDLRRVTVDELAAHYKNICAQEGITADDEAISMIARAADGSVRDGLSILDQAISLSENVLTTDTVKSMLGLNERMQTLELFKALMEGNTSEAFDLAAGFYERGQEPVALIKDMTEICHLLTKIKAVPKARRTVAPNMSDEELSAATKLAQSLSVPSLGKAWQILLKGTGEIVSSPQPQAVLEMILIRLCYASDLPDPADLIKKLHGSSGGSASAGGQTSGNGQGNGATARSSSATASVSVMNGHGNKTRPGTASQSAPSEKPETMAVANGNLDKLEDVVALLESNGAMLLASQIDQFVQLISLRQGKIEFLPAEHAPSDLSSNLQRKLLELTGRRWAVTIGRENAQPTLRKQREKREREELDKIMAHPFVSEVIKVFPGAEIIDIKEKTEEEEIN